MLQTGRGGSRLRLCCGAGSGTVSVYIGSPRNWQISLQKSASPVMAHTVRLTQLTNVLLLPIIVVIPIIITTLCAKYSAKTATSRNHINTSAFLEGLWATIPAAILVCICLPSFRVLKHQLAQKKNSYTTIRVVAHQWYWNYKYNFNKCEFEYDSNLLEANRRQLFCKTNLKSYPKLLAVDYELVIPVAKVVRLLITSADVIHAFAVPSLGIKVDAIPGKTNETWIKVTKIGIYYGQCSEFCGKNHSYMPIAIRVTSVLNFENWANRAPAHLESAFNALRADAKAREHSLRSANEKWTF
ncbi:MAG: cytochrome c oxidase subunit II [Candidatus Hodgkinia cicadicola]